jgi:hypothetical protein
MKGFLSKMGSGPHMACYYLILVTRQLNRTCRVRVNRQISVWMIGYHPQSIFRDGEFFCVREV